MAVTTSPDDLHLASTKGIWSWITTVDHKRIGILYMWVILFWFCVAVVLGVLLRTELVSPGVTIMEADTYNAVFTLHGVLMVFLFLIPAMPAIFGNFLLPIHIGADDVFFPRLNLLSWYLYVSGGVLAIVSPIIVGVLLGKTALGAMLIGATVAGFMLAITMANAGGSWDNAKKFIELGHHGGKGSDPHKAGVVGDTVGDPFKDTSGPSLNILIKVMSIMSLVLAPLYVALGEGVLGMLG